MKTKMTFARLQEKVAAAAGISKNEARVLMKEIAAAVETGLVTEGKVNLAGLGRFDRRIQSARKGRNPQTGEPIDIPEKNRVHFLPDAQLRRFINREFEHLPAVPAPPPQTTSETATVEIGVADPPSVWIILTAVILFITRIFNPFNSAGE